ncbi:hypothetical protein HOD20_04255 [archaeon]|jgi:hypothetical protein|nr:hypothetical protein [archaeon]MBT4647782.1 hypothetical protein [archaeon]MBT6821643.1 hypothetical protein [archaeon]MBT7391829.1 hypothetical protein [archaeon]
MKQKLNLTKFIVIGSMAVLIVAFSLIGLSINAITGGPYFGGFLNSFGLISIGVVCVLIINRFGSGTMMYSILSILAIPLPLLGPSGLILKVPMIMLSGVIADLIYLIFKSNKLLFSLFVGGPILYFYSYMLAQFSIMLDIPGFDLTIKLLSTPLGIVLNLLFGAIFGYVGYLIYNKIKNTSIVKRIQR